MFPLRDHNPSGRTPYVVYTLMALNILAYAFYTISFDTERELAQFYDAYALIPAEIDISRRLSPLVSSMFLHGGFMHLAGNMLFLWIFGDNMEDEMGHLPFLAFYIACGIGAGLIHVASAPWSHVPTIGASGAVAGVMGGYLLLFPRARIDILLILIIYFRIFAIPAYLMLGVWLAMQFIGSLNSDPSQGGVAYWAHTGGFAVGLLLTVPLWVKRGARAFWGKTHGQPPHPQAKYKYSASRIPRLPRKKPGRSPWGSDR
ncbi:rhomboid family intramembrane serine protease [Parasedimentitalea huanghaiensis]|uniref:Rhomboid family intramembrane serine protease n=1 Tax=Parasedimentitalea huanghaiensis TaxID=2682100 RepID=A0A6L6WGQ9_9RHOB|nr:rhomboid family intramembrane serine protease [Zongyanglinia huanghaiensis]MVO16884.1 rhomboid family intramembrane serine protease [Zongyanglinia huanghaiensis]